MILLIDCGNRNIVFALAHSGARLGEGGGAGEILARWRTASDPIRTADDYGVWFSSALATHKVSPASVEAVILSSVVPELDPALETLSHRLFGRTPLRALTLAQETGLAVRLPDPSTAGEDRIANAVGAATLRPQTRAVVVDFGTATTFDCVEHDGAYMGGLIAPGIALSIEALHAGTARLPRIWLERPERLRGTDTISAMHAGLYWGYVSMVEGLLERLRHEYGQTSVLATGGFAPLLSPDLPSVDLTEPDLTLLGLATLYERHLVAKARA